MIPKDKKFINTNMPQSELYQVIDALNLNQVIWEDGSLYAGSRTEQFTWRGSKYELHEWFETVDRIDRIKN